MPITHGYSNVQDYNDTILLTKVHLPILRYINSISNNVSIKILFSHIIKNIIEEKVIDVDDINKIVEVLNMKSVKISFLRFIYGTSDSGKFFCFPGYFFSNFFAFYWSSYNELYIPYIGPSIIMIGDGWLNIGINEYSGSFIIIGFLGLISSNHYEHFSDYLFIGFSYFTIIIY